MWNDVAFKMPDRNSECDYISNYVIVSEGERVGHGYYNFDDCQWTYDMPGMIEVTDDSITHWMSLLTPPKSDTAEAVEQPLTQVKTPPPATPEGEICRCKHGHTWRELTNTISCVPLNFCSSCGGKLLVS